MNLGPTACMVIANTIRSADRSQVKVMYWVNNDEQNSLTGITARFGLVLPASVYDGKKESFAVPKPESGCAKTAGTLAGAVALVQRGECTFIEKAKAAEASGASALVIINDEDGRSVVLDLQLLLSLAPTSLVANTGGWRASVPTNLLCYRADLQRMICTDKDPPPNINIPVVMVSKSAGAKLRAADESQLHGDHANRRRLHVLLLLALVFPCDHY
jgi:signal peptide peptidase-like 2B